MDGLEIETVKEGGVWVVKMRPRGSRHWADAVDVYETKSFYAARGVAQFLCEPKIAAAVWAAL